MNLSHEWAHRSWIIENLVRPGTLLLLTSIATPTHWEFCKSKLKLNELVSLKRLTIKESHGIPGLIIKMFENQAIDHPDKGCMAPIAITIGILQIYTRVGNAAFVTLGTLLFLSMARVDQIYDQIKDTF